MSGKTDPGHRIEKGYRGFRACDYVSWFGANLHPWMSDFAGSPLSFKLRPGKGPGPHHPPRSYFSILSSKKDEHRPT